MVGRSKLEEIIVFTRHTTLDSVLGFKYERKKYISLFHTLQTIQVRRLHARDFKEPMTT